MPLTLSSHVPELSHSVLQMLFRERRDGAGREAGKTVSVQNEINYYSQLLFNGNKLIQKT